jgi:hypothetical protein
MCVIALEINTKGGPPFAWQKSLLNVNRGGAVTDDSTEVNTVGVCFQVFN